MISSNSSAPAPLAMGVDLKAAARASGALALVGAAILAGARGETWVGVLLATVLATFGVALAAAARLEPVQVLRAGLPIGLAAGVLAASTNAGLRVWQAPPTWHEALSFSPAGGGLAIGLLLVATLTSLLWRGRGLRLPEAVALFALPYLFTSLFLLSSAHLLADIGRAVGVGRWFGWYGEATFGRIVLLFLLNEIVLVGGAWLMDGRWTRSWRLRALLLLSAVFASLTPRLASFGASETMASLPFLLQVVCVPAMAAVALAGLWGQTFLLTGVALDAMRGRRPTYEAGVRHWREGTLKGGVYSAIFMLLVQLAAMVVNTPTIWAVLAAVPLASSTLAGALLYPLGRTVIESFDGSAPFVHRLRANAADPVGYWRGLVVGCGAGLALTLDLPLRDPLFRFLCGGAIGAMAYAGVDLALDLRSIRRGSRQHVQIWRFYALAGMLGGIVGGTIAWYLDTAQVAVIAARFQAYATVHAQTGDYVIYPLFSKWGAVSLGPAEGGVRLLYNESLSGVINWSLAAPLFSINLVLLTALLQRSMGPIRNLLSAHGVVGLVEQAIRVLRWGLWMAPVIYSFLRMAPDPTWYNQDGAVRTVVASVQSWWLTPEAFRTWSLQVFLGLLAYDWFRVLIWFDHMGLRVATLVNLSFIGGDLGDERAARWLGHSGRARIIPDGLRRFATWAPLLIPFYIPRGAEWDQVWVEAERLQAGAPSLLPPVGDVLVGYGVLGGAMLLVAILMRWRAGSVAATPTAPAAPAPAWAPTQRFRLGNGTYTLEASADGRSFSRTLRDRHEPPELDLTRRSVDPLQLGGKFFYLRELNGPERAPGLCWSLGWQPARHAGASFAIEQPSPTSLRLANDRDGILAEAVVEVAADEPQEMWRLRLSNRTDQPRTIELTSYQELAIAPFDSYRRTPSYNALHVGTCFVRALGAVIARNRHLHPSHAKGGGYPFAREVAFHAVAASDPTQVRLVGYQDARPCFIGSGTLAEPEILASGRMRAVDDEGLLYGFDPIASLQLRVELPAFGTVELRFLDGYAADEKLAAKRIAAHLGQTPPSADQLAAVYARSRTLASSLRPAGDATPPYEFSPVGTELVITGRTPRPWTHVLANPQGHGAVLDNAGEIFSFAGNAQQNALTPCYLDSVPTQVPASALYVVDLATGRVDTPTMTPQRCPGAVHDTVYGRGYATYRMRRAPLELELTVFIPPDQPAEIRLLTIRNHGTEAKRFRVVPYFEMALAELPTDTQGRLQVRTDTGRGAYYFRNPSNDFHHGWAFVTTTLQVEHQEHVRQRFLGGPGRDASLPYLVEHGASDAQARDDGRRIAAFIGTVEVPAGGKAQVAVVLGQVLGLAQAEAMAERYASLSTAEQALTDTVRFWAETLGQLRIETDQPAFDRLVNDWLPYQLLTARLWGRCGPNQRGGAFGFRDQLQDALPLLATRPDLARRQILLHARQQFREGDVLQWWHPAPEGGTGLGARNNASDPHLWLPYLVTRYVEQTGDRDILAEPVPFLEGRPIPRGAEGVNFVPRPSGDVGSLGDHCRRAIAFTLSRMGSSGLPLIGSGDWNDGLSRAGGASGESVWLGFFLYDVLTRYAPLAGDGADATRYGAAAVALREQLNGMWHEDRFPRLVASNGDAISWFDALMGSWPVLSGAVDFERGLETVEGALSGLEKEHQVLLLTPWFGEQSPLVPGRIADYPPGVRENGGQYSHGSSWLVDALVELADKARADGDAELAAHLRARALAVWYKISPVGKTGPELLDVYGLSPHQQPADIYFGPGYEGRGGWSWYTGAAGRMLSGAYAILGLRLLGGQLVVAPGAFAENQRIQLRRVLHQGADITPRRPPQPKDD